MDRTPDGLTLSVGTTETGSVTVGPLAVRDEVALEFLSQDGCYHFGPPTRAN